ncbi:MAG TPA: hypothetical protein VJ842_16235 [Pyrinomonadaceae bacterium]|nr:hypothetical protein [Pyrinomonadaceae bacterium]
MSATDDIEAVLLFLKQQGCSKIDSILALRDLKGMNLKDGKETVHLSQTWQDRRDADEHLWDELFDSMKEFEREHPEND